MKRRSIVSLLKGVFLVQVFVIIVLIGVAGSLQQIKPAHHKARADKVFISFQPD